MALDNYEFEDWLGSMRRFTSFLHCDSECQIRNRKMSIRLHPRLGKRYPHRRRCEVQSRDMEEKMSMAFSKDAMEIMSDVREYGDHLTIELEYPNHRSIKAIEIDLMDVRASDGIRIEYDFERDGWVISQPQVLEWKEGDGVCDPQWKEMAFLQSWPFDEVDE